MIGDCAQSFGSKYNNKSTINYYDYAATSFYPTRSFLVMEMVVLFFKGNYKNALRLKNNGHDLKTNQLLSNWY